MEKWLKSFYDKTTYKKMKFPKTPGELLRTKICSCQKQEKAQSCKIDTISLPVIGEGPFLETTKEAKETKNKNSSTNEKLHNEATDTGKKVLVTVDYRCIKKL